MFTSAFAGALLSSRGWFDDARTWILFLGLPVAYLLCMPDGAAWLWGVQWLPSNDGLMFCEVFQCTVSGRRPLSSIVHGGGKLVLFDYCSVWCLWSPDWVRRRRFLVSYSWPFLLPKGVKTQNVVAVTDKGDSNDTRCLFSLEFSSQLGHAIGSWFVDFDSHDLVCRRRFLVSYRCYFFSSERGWNPIRHVVWVADKVGSNDTHCLFGLAIGSGFVGYDMLI